jgi:hypothetical protein
MNWSAGELHSSLREVCTRVAFYGNTHKRSGQRVKGR